ncbi:conserved membrane protein of unknown function [Tenacibaculum soleae]|uniref:DEAD/DEAH box helicase family protein n=1 Tax=Tenacibaculum soleae TaxID=447689 RepID=UPI003AB46E81
MSTSIKQLNFLYTWRPYQDKILLNFSKHIEDNHFHIVAPPGSGKTILGIEILKRIGKKTLVLAPTLTIRNQWENRLQTFFTKNGDFKNFSFDIKKPADITFSTYQGLHAFYKTFECKDDYFSFFTKNNIDVILLDEAHHLKKEWWKCLYQLKEQHLQTVVALTATPPYDSESTEIQKYFDLCGKVDDEIFVPDLVKEKNLCPHQDIVYFSKPENKEINTIVNFRLKVSDFITNLLNDQEFIDFIKQHRFYKNTEENLADIYKFSTFFSAILIFLNEAKTLISKEKLTLLGFEKDEIVEFPKITHAWIEILLQHILVIDRTQLINHENYLYLLEKKLRKLSIFSNNRVNLIGSTFLYKSLSNSTSKLKSIVAIVQQEQVNLKDTLRCVVLADYIRKEYLDVTSNNIQTIKKMGVVPIFHHLKKTIDAKEYLAVLSGSLVIIHCNCIAKLDLIDSITNYTQIPLKSDAEYIILQSKSSSNSGLVKTITQLFQLGHIKILIGTKSLLGEGWDAPAINSLILASVVGSFVSSNQMRGRAIRIDTKALNKTALIWHLACIDTSDIYGGKDLAVLKKRFDAFIGINNSEKNIISNGIERLALPNTIFEEDINTLNKTALSISKNRLQISNKWKNAVRYNKDVAQELKIYHQKDNVFLKQKTAYFKDFVKFSILEVLISLTLFFPQFIIKNINIVLSKGIYYFIYSLLTTLGLTFGFKIYKTLKMYFHYGLIHKKIDKIAQVVLSSLDEINEITTLKSEINIKIKSLTMGDVSCVITGASKYESNLFINTLDEILQPIDNPKYLIIKTNWFRNKLKTQNFYPVPTIFSARKKQALVYQKHWNKNLGKSLLIYTRNTRGRKLLLRAKLFHVRNIQNEMTKKNIIWK